MQTQYTELFQFESEGMPHDLFHVVRFQGTEGLNTLFSFTIDLVSRKVDVDTAAVLRNRGVFTVIRKDGSKAVFSGYPAAITQSGHFNGYTYYSVVLQPTFRKLCDVVQSRIFLNKNIKDAVSELLTEQPYFTFPHEFRLGVTSYPVPEFAMQYEENVYDYICWRLESQGIAWHIEQDGKNDKLIFSDIPSIYTALPQTPALRYSPPSGMQVNRDEELITAFNLSCHPLPKRVVIRTYNWQNPNKPVVGTAQVSAEGLGDVFLATEAVGSDAEANRTARIRAEALQCRGRLYSGISAVPTMRPGFLFTLEEHYNPAFNRQYFLTEVTHEGSQEAFLSLGLGIPMHNTKEHFFYHNNFTCIESGIQYRPQRKAPRTAVHGVIHAFIDGAGSGARPEMDTYGRYKVLFPFDISSRKDGNASCWIRMAQPQVGNKSGMAFPLLPGTEVTVTFLDGSPDLPIITGALPNGETGSLTSGTNTNATGIRTAGGNQLVFNDEDNKQGILLGTPAGRGISISSGSLNSTNITADAVLETATLASAEISSLGNTLYSGFKSTTMTCNKSFSTYIGAVTGLLTGLVSPAFDLFSKHNDKTLESAFGSDLAKMLNLAVQAGVSYHIQNAGMQAGQNAETYGSTIMQTPNASATVLQVEPKTADLVAGIVLSIIGKSFQIGAEALDIPNREKQISAAEKNAVAVAKMEEELLKAKLDAYKNATEGAYWEKQIKEAEASGASPEKIKELTAKLEAAQKKPPTVAEIKALEDALNKAKKDPYTLKEVEELQNKKNASVHQLLTSGVGSLIPEILTWVLTVKALTNPKKAVKGGVVLKSVENNISLVAGGPVSMHSPTGILLNTQHITPALATTASFATDAGPASDWGTTGKNKSTAIYNYMEEQQELGFVAPVVPEVPEVPVVPVVPAPVAPGFVVTLSNLIHQKSDYHKIEAQNTLSLQAKNHWIRTPNKSISIIASEGGTGGAAPGIALQVTQATGTSQILHCLQTATSAAHTVMLHTSGVTINSNDATKNSTISCTGETLTLHTEENSTKKADITLGAAGITLRFNEKNGVILDDNSVLISPNGNAQVAGIKFSKNQIDSTTGGKIVIGGELEIIGTKGSANLAALERQHGTLLSQINDLQNAVAEASKMQEKIISK